MQIQNPILDDVFNALMQQHSWKTHELASHLRTQGWSTPLDADANQDLFKRNFLVMNALFHLQQELMPQGLTIDIVGFTATLVSITTQTIPIKVTALASYYLDWHNFTPSNQEIEQLLNDFWQDFGKRPTIAPLNHSDVASALARFELSADCQFVDANKRWRQLAVIYHPDKSGGNTEKFQQLQNDWQLLRQYFKR
ncbi:DNA-J related domain-containing protein [Pseudoalteromonas tunicata]|uniref:Putative DnaJ-class molecular chaperone n=1 Tax=Pseudoalteromonas tunicata D2 TaxID=87626 RepID=A4CFB6_9GAMM|nr:DNA-J related domain-containing protein [Pseudoalteromonas tunicata]ATC92949.1 hypothetical protein PTUN_a0108 [Pseudoalteromonas tunicata]EAR26554.1 putative DnaJ-class molecular chaperone [Pseudoalteromonas tunicata D2]MDP4984194.1 molecular chaperone DnaJ [Pseudoalteromonas tunicata]MDP5214787.1 molecular chaperone DnaJ [Pseudoalteromonas tunicata]